MWPLPQGPPAAGGCGQLRLKDLGSCGSQAGQGSSLLHLRDSETGGPLIHLSASRCLQGPAVLRTNCNTLIHSSVTPAMLRTDLHNIIHSSVTDMCQHVYLNTF